MKKTKQRKKEERVEGEFSGQELRGLERIRDELKQLKQLEYETRRDIDIDYGPENIKKKFSPVERSKLKLKDSYEKAKRIPQTEIDKTYKRKTEKEVDWEDLFGEYDEEEMYFDTGEDADVYDIITEKEDIYEVQKSEILKLSKENLPVGTRTKFETRQTSFVPIKKETSERPGKYIAPPRDSSKLLSMDVMPSSIPRNLLKEFQQTPKKPEGYDGKIEKGSYVSFITNERFEGEFVGFVNKNKQMVVTVPDNKGNFKKKTFNIEGISYFRVNEDESSLEDKIYTFEDKKFGEGAKISFRYTKEKFGFVVGYDDQNFHIAGKRTVRKINMYNKDLKKVSYAPKISIGKTKSIQEYFTDEADKQSRFRYFMREKLFKSFEPFVGKVYTEKEEAIEEVPNEEKPGNYFIMWNDIDVPVWTVWWKVDDKTVNFNFAVKEKDNKYDLFEVYDEDGYETNGIKEEINLGGKLKIYFNPAASSWIVIWNENNQNNRKLFKIEHEVDLFREYTKAVSFALAKNISLSNSGDEPVWDRDDNSWKIDIIVDNQRFLCAFPIDLYDGREASLIKAHEVGETYARERRTLGKDILENKLKPYTSKYKIYWNSRKDGVGWNVEWEFEGKSINFDFLLPNKEGKDLFRIYDVEKKDYADEIEINMNHEFYIYWDSDKNSWIVKWEEDGDEKERIIDTYDDPNKFDYYIKALSFSIAKNISLSEDVVNWDHEDDPLIIEKEGRFLTFIFPSKYEERKKSFLSAYELGENDYYSENFNHWMREKKREELDVNVPPEIVEQEYKKLISPRLVLDEFINKFGSDQLNVGSIELLNRINDYKGDLSDFDIKVKKTLDKLLEKKIIYDSRNLLDLTSFIQVQKPEIEGEDIVRDLISEISISRKVLGIIEELNLPDIYEDEFDLIELDIDLGLTGEMKKIILDKLINEYDINKEIVVKGDLKGRDLAVALSNIMDEYIRFPISKEILRKRMYKDAVDAELSEIYPTEKDYNEFNALYSEELYNKYKLSFYSYLEALETSRLERVPGKIFVKEEKEQLTPIGKELLEVVKKIEKTIFHSLKNKGDANIYSYSSEILYPIIFLEDISYSNFVRQKLLLGGVDAIQHLYDVGLEMLFPEFSSNFNTLSDEDFGRGFKEISNILYKKIWNVVSNFRATKDPSAKSKILDTTFESLHLITKLTEKCNRDTGTGNIYQRNKQGDIEYDISYNKWNGEIIYGHSTFEPKMKEIELKDLIMCYDKTKNLFTCHSIDEVASAILKSEKYDKDAINPYTDSKYPKEFLRKFKERYQDKIDSAKILGDPQDYSLEKEKALNIKKEREEEIRLAEEQDIRYEDIFGEEEPIEGEISTVQDLREFSTNKPILIYFFADWDVQDDFQNAWESIQNKYEGKVDFAMSSDVTKIFDYFDMENIPSFLLLSKFSDQFQIEYKTDNASDTKIKELVRTIKNLLN